MLKKFHKEKLQQLQMFNARERDSQALNDTMQAEVQEPPISADPLLTLIGSASADDLLQAVKAAEQDFDLDRLLGEPQNVCSLSLEDNGDALVVSVTEKPTTLLPDGLPPTLEQHIKELSQVLFALTTSEKSLQEYATYSHALLVFFRLLRKLKDKTRWRFCLQNSTVFY